MTRNYLVEFVSLGNQRDAISHCSVAVLIYKIEVTLYKRVDGISKKDVLINEPINNRPRNFYSSVSPFQKKTDSTNLPQ